MNEITLERYWVYSGAMLCFLPLFNLVKSYSFGLEILSIMFGGLLATAAIVQGSWDSNTITRLRTSGHDKILLEYITVPVYTCFILMSVQLFAGLLLIPDTMPFYVQVRMTYGAIVFALFGVLLFSTFRLIGLIAPIIQKKNDKINLNKMAR